MPVKPIPEGHRTVTPYLVAENAAGLIDFLKAGFGAEEIMRHTDPSGRIMHAQVRIGDSTVMLGNASDKSQAMAAFLYLYVADTDAFHRRAVSAGAKSLMEPADQFYGDRSSCVQDPSGNRWCIATHIEDVEPKEMERRAEKWFKEHAGGC